MRIIAGNKRGTKLAAPEDGAIRPTTDRVKEAMFGSVQFETPGAHVLDLFAGSGALGLEAASRGAAEVVMGDHDEKSVALARENWKRVGSPENVKIIKNDWQNIIKLFKNQQKFDIVLIDPPYSGDLYQDIVQKLTESGVFKNGALMILESNRPLEVFADGLEVEKTKTYGETVLTYCRFRKENDA